jgi:hypothetical protein
MVNISNPQQNPDLLARAYGWAWWNNYYTALYYNITSYSFTNNSAGAFGQVNSSIGQTLPLPSVSNTSAVLNILQLTEFYGDYLCLGDLTTDPPLFQSVVPNSLSISLSNLLGVCESFNISCKSRLF